MHLDLLLASPKVLHEDVLSWRLKSCSQRTHIQMTAMQDLVGRTHWMHDMPGQDCYLQPLKQLCAEFLLFLECISLHKLWSKCQQSRKRHALIDEVLTAQLSDCSAFWLLSACTHKTEVLCAAPNCLLSASTALHRVTGASNLLETMLCSRRIFWSILQH